MRADNAAEIFNVLSTLPGSLTDVDKFLKDFVLVAEDPAVDSALDTSSITDVIIEDNRRRHVSFLLSQQGTYPSPLLTLWQRHVQIIIVMK